MASPAVSVPCIHKPGSQTVAMDITGRPEQIRFGIGENGVGALTEKRGVASMGPIEVPSNILSRKNHVTDAAPIRDLIPCVHILVAK